MNLFQKTFVIYFQVTFSKTAILIDNKETLNEMETVLQKYIWCSLIHGKMYGRGEEDK